jgi:DNA-binding CsgD family transcriptional regulator
MKADAKACNKRMRQNCGVSSFALAAINSGYRPKQSPGILSRREDVWGMYESGMTQSQISTKTGLTLSTVKSDIFMMRRKMKDAA